MGRSAIWASQSRCLLLGRDATVTICHSRTEGLDCLGPARNIGVAAVGRPELIRGSWIKPSAVVIDAGCRELERRRPEGRLLALGSAHAGPAPRSDR